MRRNYLYIKSWVITLLVVAALSGCNKIGKGESTYTLEDFEVAMNDLGYDFVIKDVSRDFLQTTRKRMIIDDIAIDIYTFGNDKEMDIEAGYIDEGGCGYNNGHRAVKVSWISYPHFYKKGSLIVQYIGEDSKIIRDLEDIMGEQFAGKVL
ncbi:MAG: hypothetical protein GX129_06365 [Clostridiales bacterium]|nr:hypothetical protein [Clostridiales bacterium]